MSSYFPIPPEFELRNSNEKITTTISLPGYCNNCSLSSYENNDQNHITYSIYKHNNSIWEKVNELSCEYGELIEVNNSNFDFPKNDLLVAICSTKGLNPIKTKYLPKPNSLLIDELSPVAERASYNFHFKNISSSYQGEYPSRMADSKKGSLFSINFSHTYSLNQQTSNYILLININRDSTIKIDHNIYFIDPYSKEVLAQDKVFSNSFNIICLEDYKLKNNRKEFMIVCKTCMFIPIYLNLFMSNDFNEINVEHTHPPSQYFWPDTHIMGTKLIKESWMNSIKD